MREAILRAGFSLVAWNDVSEIALSRLGKMIAKSKTSGFPRLGLHLLMGAEFSEMIRNLHANLGQRRCAVMQGLFARVEGVAERMAAAAYTEALTGSDAQKGP